MKVTEELLRHYEREAIRCIKACDRGTIHHAATKFHEALHKLRSRIPNPFLMEEAEKWMEAIYAYPEVLRVALDARDQLNEIAHTGKSLRAWQEVQLSNEAKEADGE